MQAFIQEHKQDNAKTGAAAGALAMPSKAELRAAEEHSLVRAIEHAGGFLAVAQVQLKPRFEEK